MTACLFATLLFLNPNALETPDNDGAEIARRWAEAQKSVTSVHATFNRHDYDYVFQTVKFSTGEVTALSPDRGIWSIAPHTRKNPSKTFRRGDMTFAVKDALPSKCIWNDGELTIIDEKTKHADQLPSHWTLFGTKFFPLVTEVSPFLPGLPNGTTISEWTFSVESETEQEVRLKALPIRSDNPRFKSCDLILRKPDLTLKALQFADAVGTTETVLIFKTVELNPKSMPEIDLGGYTINGTTLPGN